MLATLRKLVGTNKHALYTGTDNEYEQQRQRNMARNAQMLSALLDHRAAA